MPERATIGYVLKGFPRLSETFIASEIHRVERLGVPLRLFVIKPVESWERGARHPVVDRIRARPAYLPGTTPLTECSTLRWLRDNLPHFGPAVARTARRHPLGAARATAAALAQGVRARKRPWQLVHRVYVKELLQALALADQIDRTPEVRHLHAHFAHGATTVTWLAAKVTGRPFSFTAHARDIYAEELNPAGLLRRKLLAAEFVVTCTEANRAHLAAIAPEATVHRVYHGLSDDFDRMLEDAPARVERNGTLRLLGVGRLVRKKGFDLLVEACAELDRRGIDFEARLVGQDGEHADELRALIAARGLEQRVELAGPRTQPELCREYRSADALCVPCRILDNDRDGIPNVLVEAMACELPVVSTAVSGIPELVTDGVNGLLVAAEEPVALADALARLDADRALGARLAQAGARTVQERFDGDAQARALVELFAQVTP